MKNILTYSLCLITFVFSNVISSELSEPLIKEGGDMLSNQDLRIVIKKYYTSEMRNEWKETYNMRSLSFRDAVSFLDYSREMTSGADGWTLINISIKEVNNNTNNAEILIRFDELINENVKYRKLISALIRDDEFLEEVEFNSNTNILSYTENTLWRFEENNWVAIEPGTRNHFYMNYKVVSE